MKTGYRKCLGNQPAVCIRPCVSWQDIIISEALPALQASDRLELDVRSEVEDRGHCHGKPLIC